MCRFTVLAFSFLFYEQTVFSATVDQRQTGDLNVQIDLKNLQIVGLMKGKEEYVVSGYLCLYTINLLKYLPDVYLCIVIYLPRSIFRSLIEASIKLIVTLPVMCR